MSEYDDVDAMIERMAREEQDEINRKHGQQLLDIFAARNNQGAEPFLEAMNQAHQAKASEAEADKE
jgi:hypothetical protein